RFPRDKPAGPLAPVRSARAPLSAPDSVLRFPPGCPGRRRVPVSPRRNCPFDLSPKPRLNIEIVCMFGQHLDARKQRAFAAAEDQSTSTIDVPRLINGVFWKVQMMNGCVWDNRFRREGTARVFRLFEFEVRSPDASARSIRRR